MNGVQPNLTVLVKVAFNVIVSRILCCGHVAINANAFVML